eukprot:1318308-Amorphochlora_amoeboformis.AAC.1
MRHENLATRVSRGCHECHAHVSSLRKVISHKMAISFEVFTHVEYPLFCLHPTSLPMSQLTPRPGISK